MMFYRLEDGDVINLDRVILITVGGRVYLDGGDPVQLSSADYDHVKELFTRSGPEIRGDLAERRRMQEQAARAAPSGLGKIAVPVMMPRAR